MFGSEKEPDGDDREKRGEWMRMEDGEDDGFPLLADRDNNDANEGRAEEVTVVQSGCRDCCCCCCCCMNLVEKSCEASKSSVVIRSVGSLRSRELITTRASGEIEVGIWNSPLRILPNRWVGFVSWNGYRPTSIVYRITPSDQQSAPRPEYRPLTVDRISGDA